MNENKPLALLIFPPVYDFAFYDLFVKPYGLLVIARMLESSGFNVRIIDCLDYEDRLSTATLGTTKRYMNGTGKAFRQIIEKPESLANVKRNYSRYGIVSLAIEHKLRNINPDIVLVSTGMTYWYPGVVEVVELSKRIHPRVPVVVGGVYATLMPDHCKKATCADYVVPGDAVSGLASICGKLGIPATFTRAAIPMIHESFRDAGCIRLNKGCPYSCDYCASSIVSGAFEPGDPEVVFGSVRELHERFGTHNFAFYDDALLVRKEETFVPFLELIIASRLKLDFYLPNGIHLAYLDDRIARLMKNAGFREIRFGFESSRPDFHSSHDVKLETEMLAEKAATLREAGFEPHKIAIYVLAGLPGQYKEEIEDTIRHGTSLGVKIHVAEFSPVPGTRLWKECVLRSCFPIEDEPLVQNNTILPMQWEGFTYRDLENLKRLAHELSPEEGS